MTVLEPGAKLVLTHGFTERPLATAFLAKRPAATRTEGCEVLVQEVIAAVTTEPCPILAAWPSILTSTCVPAGAGRLPFLSFSLRREGKVLSQDGLTAER